MKADQTSSKELHGKLIAILATDGFEQEELMSPKEAMEAAGADVRIVSSGKQRIKGWKHSDWGDEIDVDQNISEARPEEFDALVLPGGVMNPDVLRQDPAVVAFVREMFKLGRTIGAICHGPWTLIEAGVVKGQRVTSFKSIKTDLTNAGGHWVDEEVVADKGLVTSRQPSDLPAFNSRLVSEIKAGFHTRDGHHTAPSPEAAAA